MPPKTRIEGLAAAGGVTDLQFDEDGKLDKGQIDEMQAAMATTVGNVDHIARAVEYVIGQPIEIDIEELVIRPQKSLF